MSKDPESKKNIEPNMGVNDKSGQKPPFKVMHGHVFLNTASIGLIRSFDSVKDL